MIDPTTLPGPTSVERMQAALVEAEAAGKWVSLPRGVVREVLADLERAQQRMTDTSDFSLILTTAGDRQQLHCTGHDPQLLLGDWPAFIDDWDPADAEGLTNALVEHRAEHRPAHPGAWADEDSR